MSAFREIQMKFERYCQIDDRIQEIDAEVTKLNEAQSGYAVIGSQTDYDRIVQERAEYSKHMGALVAESLNLKGEQMTIAAIMAQAMLDKCIYILRYKDEVYEVYPQLSNSTNRLIIRRTEG